ncbi:MAG: hypothetical protein R3E66_03585 [bacterium]
MKTILLVAIALTAGCVHATPAENRTGEDISRAASEATRRDLKEGSPALYSTSKAPEPEAKPAVAEPESQVAPTTLVRANPNGTYTVDESELTLEQLSERLGAAEPKGAVRVTAAPKATQENVAKAVDLAKSLGYEDVAIEPSATP